MRSPNISINSMHIDNRYVLPCQASISKPRHPNSQTRTRSERIARGAPAHVRSSTRLVPGTPNLSGCTRALLWMAGAWDGSGVYHSRKHWGPTYEQEDSFRRGRSGDVHIADDRHSGGGPRPTCQGGPPRGPLRPGHVQRCAAGRARRGRVRRSIQESRRHGHAPGGVRGPEPGRLRTRQVGIQPRNTSRSRRATSFAPRTLAARPTASPRCPSSAVAVYPRSTSHWV